MLARPEWDTYFMTLCFLIAQRSIDPNTKHGTVVVDEDHNILATGYNSPPRNCVDDIIPLTRPEKYSVLLHAEEAAIVNAARNGIRLKDSIFYITGEPCIECLRKILSVGAKKVIYGGVQSKCLDEKDKKLKKIIMQGQSLIIEEFIYDWAINNLLKTTEYYKDEKYKKGSTQ